MSVIESRINRASPEFVANAEVNRRLAGELRELVRRISAGGSTAARQQHESRGKMFVRDRIGTACWPGSPVPRGRPAGRPRAVR